MHTVARVQWIYFFFSVLLIKMKHQLQISFTLATVFITVFCFISVCFFPIDSDLHGAAAQHRTHTSQVQKDSSCSTNCKNNSLTGSSTRHFLSHTNSVIDSSSVHNSNISAVGYWITLTYGGQMTKAVRNMMLHQCLAWALSASLRVVEPFAFESNLFHSPMLWGGHSMKFSDYYNLSYYNHMSKIQKGAPLVTWDEFLDRAPREAILLGTPMKKPCPTLTTASEFNGSSLKQNPTECNFPSDVLDGLVKYNFSFIKILCIDCMHLHNVLELNELKQQVYGDRDISEVTLVTIFLRSYGFIKSWVEIPQLCSGVQSQGSDDRLISSSSVVSHTEYYITNLHGNRNVTTFAVMFRFERFFLEHHKSEESLMECLNETVKLYDQLKQQHSNSKVFLALDIGRFGSKGMQRNRVFGTTGIAEERMYRIIHDTLQYLSDGQWSLEEWEESFVNITGGITDRGYIAMLQQSIAAHSDCLVLVGGGGYQEVTARQYINNRGHTCLHTVCMPDKWKKNFNMLSTK